MLVAVIMLMPPLWEQGKSAILTKEKKICAVVREKK